MLIYCYDTTAKRWHVEGDHGLLCRGSVQGNAVEGYRRVATAPALDIQEFLYKADLPCRTCWERLDALVMAGSR